ncbi:metalloregulator ArsR/SmtB family transcription factor [Ruminococcus sp.]|uniref:metalloregulator ArsR/SmtB family transcription factor n=1 Tax=Ruminococcus sp. TaxID=41978 RepID=UPI002E81E9BF|nr:metalloregulator ArsR/SmtB family transcription factor [Ruminococcus sp.]MEE3491439.1 metalloregulator ArsR/SmtB family transcription factor [Ruminococcus sp.]
MSLGSTFKTLSDPQRREILMLIKKNYRMSAGEIAEALGVTPQKLSYHLKLLKESDLLIESKEKNFVYYELNASLFDELILWLKQF